MCKDLHTLPFFAFHSVYIPTETEHTIKAFRHLASWLGENYSNGVLHSIPPSLR